MVLSILLRLLVGLAAVLVTLALFSLVGKVMDWVYRRWAPHGTWQPPLNTREPPASPVDSDAE
ncbi:hypothetical protein [Ferrimonas marina]|uniref:Uncharacterized protein n=1 Tax=Ferrimonas marina TaxID=299255 RepID=A0A1M5X161_9GAMM|nr:hypothetical protein [Ferrimonas marina]SHH93599.1 hypothetical protein SAMN02745129_3144 [Ferrimonas marina]